MSIALKAMPSFSAWAQCDWCDRKNKIQEMQILQIECDY